MTASAEPRQTSRPAYVASLDKVAHDHDDSLVTVSHGFHITA